MVIFADVLLSQDLHKDDIDRGLAKPESAESYNSRIVRANHDGEIYISEESIKHLGTIESSPSMIWHLRLFDTFR